MPDYRLDGKNPLGYMGVRPYTPPQMVVRKSAPTQNDVQGFALGTQWLYLNEATPANSLQYVLVDVSNSVATWIALNDGGALPTFADNTVILGTGMPGFTNVPSTGTVGQVLTSQGSSAKPIWTGTGSGGAFGSINVIVITDAGAGTYTPSADMVQCTVECIGAGGGAGGTATNSMSAVSFGSGGGGGGAYSRKTYMAADIGASQDYFVGSGGAGAVGIPDMVSTANGDAGDDTTFGTGGVLITAGGGGGGAGAGLPIALGGIATDGDLNIPGGSGYSTFFAPIPDLGPNVLAISGGGGNSALGFGFGGISQIIYGGGIIADGIIGSGYGAGGGGGYINRSSPPSTSQGADGTDGLIIITEYIAA